MTDTQLQEEPVRRKLRRDPVARAMQAIEYLAASSGTGQVLGVRELGRHLGVSPSSAQRLIAALIDSEALEKHENGTGYVFTRHFMNVAQQIADSRSYTEAVCEVLDELASKSTETALFGEYDYRLGMMMFTEMVESHHDVRFVARLNEWIPVYVGASGVAVMAFLPEREFARAMSQAEQMVAERSGPWTTMAELERALRTVRRTGYALTRGHRVRGAVGIFAPVRGQGERVIGSMGLNVPEQRAQSEELPKFAELVKAAAVAVEERLQ